MKKPLIAVCLLLPFVFGGCALFGADVHTSAPQGDYSYVYTPDTTAAPAPVTEEPASLPEETTLAPETAAPETAPTAPTVPPRRSSATTTEHSAPRSLKSWASSWAAARASRPPACSWTWTI